MCIFGVAEESEYTAPHNLNWQSDKGSPAQLKLLCGADLLESFGVPGLWKDADVSDHFAVPCFASCAIVSIRRHLLDNLDDKPTDETERAPVKNKISFPYCFFIQTHPASPVSGPLHRLAKELSAF